jgi:hypothetical protein
MLQAMPLPADLQSEKTFEYSPWMAKTITGK